MSSWLANPASALALSKPDCAESRQPRLLMNPFQTSICSASGRRPVLKHHSRISSSVPPARVRNPEGFELNAEEPADAIVKGVAAGKDAKVMTVRQPAFGIQADLVEDAGKYKNAAGLVARAADGKAHGGKQWRGKRQTQGPLRVASRKFPETAMKDQSHSSFAGARSEGIEGAFDRFVAFSGVTTSCRSDEVAIMHLRILTACLAVIPLPVAAAPLVMDIKNPSFEENAAALIPVPGSFTTDIVPQWTAAGSGLFRPDTPVNVAADGVAVVFLNSGSVSQVLAFPGGAPVLASAGAKLTVNVMARPRSTTGSCVLTFDARVGAVSVAAVPGVVDLATNATGYTAVSAAVTLKDAAGLGASAGQPLSLRISSAGDQANIDQVSATIAYPPVISVLSAAPAGGARAAGDHLVDGDGCDFSDLRRD